MNEKKDNLEKFIKEELEKEAENIRREIQPDEGTMSQDAKERIQENLKQQIEEYDRERLYAELSEEDREALRLGYEILRKKVDKSTDEVAEEESNDKKPGKVVRKKRRLRVSLALAAALILVVGFGLNSFGVTEKAIRVMQVMVGGREVVQTDSGEDNKIIVGEKEEEAYQLVAEEFGSEPIRITARPKEMKFQSVEYDKGIQVAELYYDYDGEGLMYMMGAVYHDFSWGIDVEDKVIKEYQKIVRGCVMRVKEYELPKSKEHRYSAQFNYKGIAYFMIGTMEQEEFDEILENLYIYS